jgi:hypothetical protein
MIVEIVRIVKMVWMAKIVQNGDPKTKGGSE